MDSIVTRFKVGEAQVERDRLISHILGALSGLEVADKLIFIGGTALSRSVLPNLRLSEDIDLIVGGSRT